MKKLSFSLVFALALGILISACQAAPTPTPEPTTAATPLPPPPTVEVASGPAQCSVVSTGIAREPDPNSPFASATELDWQKGPEEATITFIEYGDFQ